MILTFLVLLLVGRLGPTYVTSSCLTPGIMHQPTPMDLDLEGLDLRRRNTRERSSAVQLNAVSVTEVVHGMSNPGFRHGSNPYEFSIDCWYGSVKTSTDPF